MLSEMGMVIEYEFYFELTPKDGYDKNSKIFGKLEEIGIPNAFIQISRATLEDVFLNLTGRSLRD
jgi:hypothetical protein